MTGRALPGLPEGRVRVAAGEACGRDGAFRSFLQQRRLPYAVAVQASFQAVLARPGLAARRAAGRARCRPGRLGRTARRAFSAGLPYLAVAGAAHPRGRG